jgi:hypothetical protein
MARQAPPPNETEEARFIRQATLRVGNAVQGLNVLASMGADVPSDVYADQAIQAIQGAFTEMKRRWVERAGTPKKRPFVFADGNINQTSLPHTEVKPTAPTPPTAKPAVRK